MSTAARSKSNRQKQLDRLQRRLNSPRPDLPILRTAERPRLTPSSPLPPGEVGRRPGEGLQTSLPTAPDTHPNLSPDSSPHLSSSASSADRLPEPPHSALPEWTRLLPLPANLPRTFRSFLYRYIEENHKPTDSHESYLAAQIAQAMARKHLSASREPEDQPNSLWLRYESLADRELKAAQRAWHTHQKTKAPSHLAPSVRPPLPLCPPLPPGEDRGEGPQATHRLPHITPLPPQTPSSLLNPSFVITNSQPIPRADSSRSLNDPNLDHRNGPMP